MKRLGLGDLGAEDLGRNRRLALVSICETDVICHFQKMEGVLNGYVTNPNPTPTLTPNRNSNPNQINEKIQKETTLEIDQITKCQFGRWKLVKTAIEGLVDFPTTRPKRP